MCSFFFFKQKTAYEMRISDWSSDVCSSDLLADLRELQIATHHRTITQLGKQHIGPGPRGRLLGLGHRGGGEVEERRGPEIHGFIQHRTADTSRGPEPACGQGIPHRGPVDDKWPAPLPARVSIRPRAARSGYSTNGQLRRARATRTARRSDEPTSEIQTLMRNPYAVF